MFDRFQYPYTFGGPELAMPILMVISLVIVLRVFRRDKSYWLKLFSVLTSWVFLAFLIYGEVYSVGKKWDELCDERMGLHVYGTVDAEGFIGVGSIETWNARGFKYVENYNSAKKKFRFTIVDGEVHKENFDKFLGEYKFVNVHEKIDEETFENISKVIRTSNNEVLGELVMIGKYPVGVDKIINGIIGSKPPYYCRPKDRDDPNKDMNYISLISAVIHPKKSN